MSDPGRSVAPAPEPAVPSQEPRFTTRENMPKIVGTRERVHQPYYDSLIRTDGAGDLRQGNVGVFGAVQSRSQLFVRQGADIAVSNLNTGGFFPSDQTFVTLAVRVWTYFRFNRESPRYTTSPTTAINANSPTPVAGPASAPVGSVTADRVQRVHKLYHQAENQLFWQFICGDKPQLTTFTAYTPFAGGLDGFFAGGGGGVGTGGGGGGSGSDPFLGSAQNFTVLGAAGITNVGGTVIQGNVGVGPASPTVTGFPPGIITGTTDAGAGATAAQIALTAAVVALNGLPGFVDTGAAELGGLTFTPGNYSHGASTLTAGAGVLTLNGGGDPNARFVFKLGSITVGPGAQIVLINGAKAHNVYFTSTSAITINTTAIMVGNLIAATTVTFANGASLVGRALAQTASVTFINNALQLDPFDPVAESVSTSWNNLYRANNGTPTSSGLMRLARPILIPPRQGFQVVAIAAPSGQANGSSIIEQLNGLVPNNDPWGAGAGGTVTGTVGTTGLDTNGRDDIEKDIKYLIDGIHSRDVL